MGRKNLRFTRRLEVIEAFYVVSKQIGLENASWRNGDQWAEYCIISILGRMTVGS